MDNKIIKIIEKKEKIKIVNEEDIEAIKDIFIGPVKDVIRIAKEKDEEVETIFKAVIPQEFIEAIKNGDFKLMESKGGEILPNIVNHKNKIVKQVRLEEVKQKREKILEQYNLGLQTDASKKTLNDWFDEWMELYVVGKVKPRTVQNYIREYERCKSYIGHKHIKMMKYYTHLEENFVNKEFDKIREKM